MWKKLFVALALTAAVGGALFAAYYRPPNEPWRPSDLVRSTVYLEIDLPQGLTAKEAARGSGCTGSGSGVLIDTDLILTVKHIAEPEAGPNCEYPELGYELVYRAFFASEPDQRLNTYGCRVKPVASAFEHDIAILQIDNLPDCVDSFSGKVMPVPLEIADSDAVQMGDQIYSFGLPDRASIEIDGRQSDEYTSVWGSGVVAAVQYTTTPRDQFITTLAAAPGASGGAVLDGVGHVIGVITKINYLNSPNPRYCEAMPTNKKFVPPANLDLNGDGRWQIWEWCPVAGSSWTYATPVAWIFSELYCIRREALLPPTAANKYDCTE
jgi:hypothetical protein